METLLTQIINSGPLDWLALLTSLTYVWLAARDNNWCWLFAAISTAVWAYQSFFEYHLVSDGLLQVFYFVMAGVGIWRWRQASDAPATTSIQHMSLIDHALTVGLSLVTGLLLYWLVSGNFTAAATLPDALTTAFSISTTFLLVYRRLENWLYWIVIDAVYVWIYGSTGAVLFAVMMVINIGMAIYGYRHWQAEMHAANTV